MMVSRFAKSGITGEAHGNPPPAFARFLTRLFGTGLGTGYAPIAQGTFGSLLFVLLWAWLVPADPIWELVVAGVVTLVSLPLSAWGERMWGGDPGRITIDEFAGQAVTLLLLPRSLFWMAAAFVLFRVFDTFKLPFIRKRIETLPGGWGVTLDDIAAGLLARIVLLVIAWLVTSV